MAQICRVIAVAMLSVWVCGAATIAHSSFDSGTEGWSIGDFFAASFSPAEGFVASGGVSGGYLETSDLYGNNAFRAPSSWLGDQSRLFGGRLRFFQRAAETDGLAFPVVVLAGAGMRLQYRDLPPGPDWTEYSVGLFAGHWEVGDGSGEASPRLATDDQIREVLSSLDWLAFHADWHTGADLIGFDEITIEGPGGDNPNGGNPNGGNPNNVHTPEPSALSIVTGLGSIVIAVVRRHRR
jgi:hypothetical protein